MNIVDVIGVIKQGSTVYFFLLFLVICFRTFRKRDKNRIEGYKHIPFLDDPSK